MSSTDGPRPRACVDRNGGSPHGPQWWQFAGERRALLEKGR
jgi:hypothetical protein